MIYLFIYLFNFFFFYWFIYLSIYLFLYLFSYLCEVYLHRLKGLISKVSLHCHGTSRKGQRCFINFFSQKMLFEIFRYISSKCFFNRCEYVSSMTDLDCILFLARYFFKDLFYFSCLMIYFCN